MDYGIILRKIEGKYFLYYDEVSEMVWSHGMFLLLSEGTNDHTIQKIKDFAKEHPDITERA